MSAARGKRQIEQFIDTQEMRLTMYTPQQVKSLQTSYPLGSQIEIYPASPMSNYTPEARGSVVAHNTQGIFVDVLEIDTDNNQTRVLKPGHDRFKILMEHGISATEFFDKYGKMPAKYFADHGKMPA